jgi:phage protein D
MNPLGYMLQLAGAPAPAPILEAVQEIEVESSIEEASVLRIRFAIAQTPIGDWSILELDPFRPLLPLGVRVQHGLGPPQAIVNGYVTNQDVSYGAEPGGSTLEVTALDATYLMNLEEKARPWPNMPDGAIAAAIFAEYGIVPQADATGPVLTEPEGTTTQRGTDVRFLRRLARRNGFDFYVQPEPLSGVDFGYFESRRPAVLPQAVITVGAGPQTNVSEFRIGYEMTRPTAAVAATLDPTTGTPQPAAAPVALELPLGTEPALARVLPPPLVRPADTGAVRGADLQRSIQATVDRSTWAVVASGTVGPDVAVLRPGGLVNVRGAGRAYNGSYFVTRVHHTLAPGRYEQRFEARRNAVGMTGAEPYLEAA